jgi:hypothetical protein
MHSYDARATLSVQLFDPTQKKTASQPKLTADLFAS